MARRFIWKTYKQKRTRPVNSRRNENRSVLQREDVIKRDRVRLNVICASKIRVIIKRTKTIDSFFFFIICFSYSVESEENRSIVKTIFTRPFHRSIEKITSFPLISILSFTGKYTDLWKINNSNNNNKVPYIVRYIRYIYIYVTRHVF